MSGCGLCCAGRGPATRLSQHFKRFALFSDLCYVTSVVRRLNMQAHAHPGGHTWRYSSGAGPHSPPVTAVGAWAAPARWGGHMSAAASTGQAGGGHGQLCSMCCGCSPCSVKAAARKAQRTSLAAAMQHAGKPTGGPAAAKRLHCLPLATTRHWGPSGAQTPGHAAQPQASELIPAAAVLPIPAARPAAPAVPVAVALPAAAALAAPPPAVRAAAAAAPPRSLSVPVSPLRLLRSGLVGHACPPLSILLLLLLQRARGRRCRRISTRWHATLRFQPPGQRAAVSACPTLPTRPYSPGRR